MLLLRPAANSGGLFRQAQDVLNAGYWYACGRFCLASPAQSPGSSTCSRKFSPGLATKPSFWTTFK